MKAIITIIVLLLVTTTWGQVKNEPQLLILAPNSVKYEASFTKEITHLNKEIKQRIKDAAGRVGHLENTDGQPENFKKMYRSAQEYVKTIDFFADISRMTQDYLIYRFYERFPNEMILIKNVKSDGNITSLKNLSDQEHLQYVLNLSAVELYKKEGISYANITIQLYDNVKNSIIINSVYSGDWRNPGFEFGCQDSSVECTVNNAISQAMIDIVDSIAANNQTIKDEAALYHERYNTLITKYYGQPYNSTIIKNVINPQDTNINISTLYQCITDADQKKLVAFFIEQVPQADFKKLIDDKKDRNVNVISGNSIKDENFLKDIPQTYAYIVKGLEYNGKWYYEKCGVTYFEAKDIEEGKRKYFNNLQEWGFFSNGTTEPSQNFWETNLFEKIKDKRKDPDWGKYSDMWASEERENRDYIGMYEMVVDELKKAKEEERKKFKANISTQYLQPYFDSIKKKERGYTVPDKEFALIYTKERDMILTPVQVKENNGKRSIRYFVLFPASNKIFEWDYFDKHPIDLSKVKDSYYTRTVVEEISSLTPWNYAYETLDNRQFWEKYILVKEGSVFKYLKPVN